MAIDIGASSGRHILSENQNGKLIIEEIYRFENGMKNIDGHLCWDLDELFNNILAGMKKCKNLGKIPKLMAIDTWAVDYVLLDKSGKRLGPSYGYRDTRVDGMDSKVYEVISQDDLYARTGIQKQPFNTIYQLMSTREMEGDLMERAENFLLLPDYFNFLLTGVKKTEYTNASTTQLLNPVTKDWDHELIKALGYKEEIFGPITMPGTEVGGLLPEIQRQLGFNLKVIQAASHDTASAVLAVPAQDQDFLYISSGTWSLMGVETREANCSKEAEEANMTNEGGYEYRFRFLKNIMGLWMIQEVRHELDDKYSFAELCQLAEASNDFPSRIDVNDKRFLAPENMIEEIKNACGESGQRRPESVGEIATVIYQSLADAYKKTVEEIQSITGKRYKNIHIVGGGSKAMYLNKLTAEKTGLNCYCGPSECTAIGNLMVQYLHDGIYQNVETARKSVFDSFQVDKI